MHVHLGYCPVLGHLLPYFSLELAVYFGRSDHVHQNEHAGGLLLVLLESPLLDDVGGEEVGEVELALLDDSDGVVDFSDDVRREDALVVLAEAHAELVVELLHHLERLLLAGTQLALRGPLLHLFLGLDGLWGLLLLLELFVLIGATGVVLLGLVDDGGEFGAGLAEEVAQLVVDGGKVLAWGWAIPC